ncbi:hypothetical protein [Sulfuritalea hydrogenivorans]|jgi:hypothetical protein|uniref:hypothetical protein n=1 Tax=Sulfuritalea hydrogenivorans TaxID=748811 RepID=UPI00149429C5|nr:hypothetical protein [Sulfuritalea hydrogenivorans]MDK9715004.1 hypothetical protein [Sulfuritalea sp.]
MFATEGGNNSGKLGRMAARIALAIARMDAVAGSTTEKHLSLTNFILSAKDGTQVAQ